MNSRLRPRSTCSAVATILVIALALRVACSFLLIPDDMFFRYDGKDYLDLAVNLSAGKGYSISYYRWFEPTPHDPPPTHPEVYRPPLLPFIGALLCRCPGNWLVMARILQASLGTASVYFAYRLASKLLGTGRGLTTAAIFASYPAAVYYSCHWSTETPFATLLVATVYLTVLSHNHPRSWFAPLAGIGAGLSTLARPNGFAVTVALSILFAITAYRQQRLRILVAFLVGVLLPLLPWTVRNWQIASILTPSTAFGAYNFCIGNNQTAYEMYLHWNDPSFPLLLDHLYGDFSRSNVIKLQSLGLFRPAEANAYWYAGGLEYMRQHPFESLYTWYRRALHYWSPFPNPIVTPPVHYATQGVLLTTILSFSIVSIWARRHTPRVVLLLTLVPLCGMLASLPFAFHQRLRFPTMEPFMIMLASDGVVIVAQRLRKMASRSIRA